MFNKQFAVGATFAGLALAAVIAGCGGGGSTAVGPPGGGGGHPSPSPSVTPILTGALNIATSGSYPNQVDGPAASVEVDFTCGCNPQAGTGMTDANGNFNLLTSSTPVPASPNPVYTVAPGRNYVVISTGTTEGTNGKAQGWTMVFAGNDTSRNQYLSGSNVSDPITAAVALYVFANSSSSSIAFDDWNFFTLQAFYQHLLNAPNTQETQLLSDIVTQQEAGVTMYPAKPRWRPLRTKNLTIANDLAAVQSSDPNNVPTPCPTPGGGPAVCTSPFPTP